MKTLELNQMENLRGAGVCSDYLAGNSDLNEYEACVVCTLGDLVGGLGGWLLGVAAGFAAC